MCTCLWNKSIKQCSPFSNSMASSSVSKPWTVSFSMPLDLTAWKNVVIGRYLNQLTMCSSMYECRFGLAWETRFCEQRRIDGRGYPEEWRFCISPVFRLVEKCHMRFIKKISHLKSDTRSCRCKNFSLKVVSFRFYRGAQAPPGAPLHPPLNQQLSENFICVENVDFTS